MNRIRRFTREGDRCHLWPIRISWGRAPSSTWFTVHGWQTGTERCASHETSATCIRGFRRTFGQTLHLGRLKVKFGPASRADVGCEELAP